ncbi:MAG: pyridoxamine 5'-phosphate oxidase family protein [Tetrasphaera jenkinsii]|jgi:hypothetical protein|uniref:Uncharacterized protein n=1 Tax=Nostocoides jenkinsii Ben 74 TaxID=1193518 RepID=A0A077M8P1_9MICO|nr:pyridoxamine 5'-phosphate oxidase family protein [Tetrasphaera jenkinsii]MCI1261262.1 pyridoxamine 5'-phosphate oxidase family protein [Tetrasphaera jenkinsii]CCI52929.1 hypothetical protein BN13_250017 [Tetrasphaera jenkinsii Ben 74]
MRLAEDEARRRLAAYDHGVLGTTHRDRGADLVPVVFAIDGDHVAIPIDTVKPKSAGRLQRERNLAADPRATLLIAALGCRRLVAPVVGPCSPHLAPR